MEPIGRPPVPAPLLITGKLALLFCWLFPLAGWTGAPATSGTGAALTAAGIFLYAGGIVFAAMSFASLGKSLAVGLPESPTILKTGGVYRVSRNPIYVAAFALCAGSCILAPHLVNLAFFVIAAGIHHRIILSEEKFLEERFGGPYLEYKRRVRRYLGTSGGTHEGTTA